MTFSILIACDDDAMSARIKEAVSEVAELKLTDAVSLDQAQERAEREHPKIVWIALDSAPVRAFSVLAALRDASPHTAYVVSNALPDSELMRTAFRLGAADFLDPAGWDAELSQTLARIKANRDMHGRHDPIASSPTAGHLNVLLVCEADIKKRTALHDLIMAQKALTLAETVSFATAVAKAKQIQPKVIWLELDPNPQRSLELLRELKAAHPRTPIFVSYETADPEFIREAFRAGASDFFDSRHWRMDVTAAVHALSPSESHGSNWLVATIGVIIAVAVTFWFSRPH